MASAEGVVGAFVALEEARDAVPTTDPGERVAPAGQHLVRIGLMTDVPDQRVVRGVVEIMQRDREFNRAETSRQVSTAACDGLEQAGAQLLGELRQLLIREAAQVRG